MLVASFGRALPPGLPLWPYDSTEPGRKSPRNGGEIYEILTKAFGWIAAVSAVFSVDFAGAG
jgi:hypothetical protein